MKRILSCISVIMLLMTLSTADLSAKEPYRHIAAVGADRSFSSGDSSLGPIVVYYYFMENFEDPELYGEFALKTTDCYFKFGKKNEKYFAGIQPNLSYIWYGGYSAYNEGEADESRQYWGNNAGVILFFQYNWSRIFSSTLAYRPDYRFYSKGFNDTAIDLPNSHWQQMASVDLLLNNVVKTDISRIKHGILAKVRYEYAHRSGYGTFRDTALVEDSHVDNTQKLFFDAGAYYNFSSDITLLLDVRAGLHYSVDRNNAEKIGYYCADHAVVPGYNAAEFYHNRYIVTQAQIGFPVPAWGTRIQPGFNLLYMPKDNDVVGVENYNKTIYKSVSVEISTKLGGLLPFFINYGYGIDAERPGRDGNHEVMLLVLAAFGEN